MICSFWRRCKPVWFPLNNWKTTLAIILKTDPPIREVAVTMDMEFGIKKLHCKSPLLKHCSVTESPYTLKQHVFVCVSIFCNKLQIYWILYKYIEKSKAFLYYSALFLLIIKIKMNLKNTYWKKVSIDQCYFSITDI